MTTTGEQVGNVVDQTVQQAEADAKSAIEAAKANADAAANEAKRIADAALSSELGQRIEGTRKDFETWRTATDQRLTEISAVNQRSEAALAETTTLLGSIQAMLTPQPSKPPEKQAENPDTAQTGASSTRTEAKEPPGAQAEKQPAPPPRKRHFL